MDTAPRSMHRLASPESRLCGEFPPMLFLNALGERQRRQREQRAIDADHNEKAAV